MARMKQIRVDAVWKIINSLTVAKYNTEALLSMVLAENDCVPPDLILDYKCELEEIESQLRSLSAWVVE